MIILILSILFFALAAMMNAVMDTLHFHFERSIFSSREESFWNPAVSWHTAKYLPYTRYKVDAWHLAKSSMIIFCALSAVCLIGGCDPVAPWWAYPMSLLIYGAIWNGTFNLFYNTLLLK